MTNTEIATYILELLAKAQDELLTPEQRKRLDTLKGKRD